MATKRDILAQAGRQLGDTSDNFRDDILGPAFDFVLAELAAWECIESVRRVHTFQIRAGVREYETREICNLTPHYPADVLSLTVPTWGPLTGVIYKSADDRDFMRLKLQTSPPATPADQWRVWRLWPNHRILEVWPAAGTDFDGIDFETAFIAPWHAITLDDDVLDIQQEDMQCITLGIQTQGATFSEMLHQDRALLEMKYESAKKRMWGRRHVRPGRIHDRRA